MIKGPLGGGAKKNKKFKKRRRGGGGGGGEDIKVTGRENEGTGEERRYSGRRTQARESGTPEVWVG